MRRACLISVLGIWLLTIPAIEAACPKGVYNDKICSSYGSCNPLAQCVCDENHFGFDCSQAKCPRGPAWVAPARATDDAHYDVECSNRGECDRQTGSCLCMYGYTGSACQRMACPNDCSDGGQCLSLRQLSQVYAVATEPLYDYAWDSNMIHGCLCSGGYHGYDCSKTSCPRGDDPLTAGQANEIQIIRCTGTGGFFHLFFNGVGTRVPWDATEDQFNDILRKVQGLPRVKATYTAGSRACSDTLMNAITVEFTQRFGPQPPFKVFNRLNGVLVLQGGQVFAAAGGAVLAGKVSVRGSKEWTFCSNRGDCDEVTGICSCYLLPMPGFRSSDGYGNPGLRGDCGCANGNNKYGGPIKSCPGELACSGHGYCSGSPSFKCICERGWATGDCSERTCPQGPAWFTAPSTTNTVHNQWMECSNAGICEKTTGQCQCYSPFTGDACNLLKCPGEPVCSGHGECMSIRQLSQLADVDDPALRFDYGVDPNNALTYDRDSVQACKCEPGYEGYDCNLRQCPRGDDPTTLGQVDEIKVIRCIATGGSFQLQYRLLTSADIPFNASPTDLRGILMSTLGFAEVVVEFSSGTSACSSATASVLNVIKLTLPLDFGNLPAMRVVPTNLVSNAVTPALPLAVANNGAVLGGIASRNGTKENIVCSNKGYCDYEKGACVCTAGYASSDGYGNVGNRGDCGYRLAKAPHEAS